MTKKVLLLLLLLLQSSYMQFNADTTSRPLLLLCPPVVLLPVECQRDEHLSQRWHALRLLDRKRGTKAQSSAAGPRASFNLVPPSSSHLEETWLFHRTLDQVKEDVGQTQFLTDVGSPFRVGGQNQVAQALERLEEIHSFNFSTCQLGEERKNQCAIDGLTADVQVKGVSVLELSLPKAWTSGEAGRCWGLLLPSVDCWDLNLGSVSPKIPHCLHSEGTRH